MALLLQRDKFSLSGIGVNKVVNKPLNNLIWNFLTFRGKERPQAILTPFLPFFRLNVSFKLPESIL